MLMCCRSHLRLRDGKFVNRKCGWRLVNRTWHCSRKICIHLGADVSTEDLVLLRYLLMRGSITFVKVEHMIDLWSSEEPNHERNSTTSFGRTVLTSLLTVEYEIVKNKMALPQDSKIAMQSFYWLMCHAHSQGSCQQLHLAANSKVGRWIPSPGLPHRYALNTKGVHVNLTHQVYVGWPRTSKL